MWVRGQLTSLLWGNRARSPAEPKGRFAPFIPFFSGIWSSTKSKPAAKSLLAHLSQPKAIEQMVAARGGHDLPAFDNLMTLQTWADEGPPKGTLYHYPNAYNHKILSIAAQPAPPKIAVQIYSQGLMTQMTVRASRWRRRSPGLRARLKATCAREVATLEA